MSANQFDPLVAKLQQTGDLFRLGKEAQASALFKQCIADIEQIARTLQQHSQCADHIKLMLNIMTAMLAAQERHDWHGLADYMQVELCECLAGLQAQRLVH